MIILNDLDWPMFLYYVIYLTISDKLCSEKGSFQLNSLFLFPTILQSSAKHIDQLSK